MPPFFFVKKFSVFIFTSGYRYFNFFTSLSVFTERYTFISFENLYTAMVFGQIIKLYIYIRGSSTTFDENTPEMTVNDRKLQIFTENGLIIGHSYLRCAEGVQYCIYVFTEGFEKKNVTKRDSTFF